MRIFLHAQDTPSRDETLFVFSHAEKTECPTFDLFPDEMVRNGTPRRTPWILLDSADWALWHAGWILVLSKRRLSLWRRRKEFLECLIGEIHLKARTPRFAWDFSEPEFLSALQAPLGVRALLPQVSLRIETCNADWIDSKGALLTRLHLAVVRGKEEAMAFCLPESITDGICSRLEALGASPVSEGALALCLKKNKVYPERISKKTFNFPAELPAREAVRRIVEAMLSTARSLEAGILDDIDTEFLHQYRVSLRRVRSTLSLLKDVYPRKTIAQLRRPLEKIASETNRLRDLDVYLLGHKELLAALPEALHPGLNILMEEFKILRFEECQRVGHYLRSPSYGKTLSELQKFFSEPDALPATASSHLPILPLIASCILRRYKKIRELAMSLQREGKNEELHTLRIQGKKLRYLLEFCREFYPRKAIESLIRKLRRMQLHLGVVNDCWVQQKYLRQHSESRPLTSKRDPRVQLAVGGLLTLLECRLHTERVAALESIESFCSKKSRSQFQELFSSTSSPRNISQNSPLT